MLLYTKKANNVFCFVDEKTADRDISPAKADERSFTSSGVSPPPPSARFTANQPFTAVSPTSANHPPQQFHLFTPQRLLEAPTYLAVLQIFQLFGADCLTVPLEADGPTLSELRTRLEKHPPAFIYLIPTFQNPSAVRYSEARRDAVAALLDEFGVTLIEDEPYRELTFDGASFTPGRRAPAVGGCGCVRRRSPERRERGVKTNKPANEPVYFCLGIVVALRASSPASRAPYKVWADL